MTNRIQQIIDVVFQTIKVLISVASVIGIGIFFYWLGLKGLVGLVAGIGIMSILLVTQNPLLMMILKATHSEWYAKELIKQGEHKNGNKKE